MHHDGSEHLPFSSTSPIHWVRLRFSEVKRKNTQKAPTTSLGSLSVFTPPPHPKKKMFYLPPTQKHAPYLPPPKKKHDSGGFRVPGSSLAASSEPWPAEISARSWAHSSRSCAWRSAMDERSWLAKRRGKAMDNYRK